MHNEPWYKSSKWRCLVDMHIPDWNEDFLGKFDPDRYAELMTRAETDACELYTGNCLGMCFFPSKVGHMHRGLKGRDIAGETLRAIGESGRGRIAYYNIWNRWAFDTHPEWRIVDWNGRNTMEDASGRRVSRFGQCCLNAPGYGDFVEAQIRQLCTDYAFDGMWIDMLGWFGSVCCCPNCRAAFLKESGLEIPEKIDFDTPEGMAFQRFREKSVADFARRVERTAHAVKPEISVVIQSTPWLGNWTGGASEEFLHTGTFLAGDFYGDALYYTSICKALNRLTVQKPIEFMTSRCIGLEDHTSTKSREELRLSACASIAHNGAFVFIDAINPDGTMDERLYEMMGELRRELEPMYQGWNPDAQLQADVLVYYNFHSNFDARKGKSAYAKQNYKLSARMPKLAETLIGAHLTYDFVFRAQLKAGLPVNKLLIVPDQSVLDEEETALLTDFVRRGGHLLATGLTGLYDPRKGRRDDFSIGKLLGLRFEEETDEDVVYLRPEEEGKLFGGYSRKYPMTVTCSAAKVRPEGAEVLSRITLPWSGTEETVYFGSAISNPPGRETEYPGITKNAFGKGCAAYAAVPLEEDVGEGQREVFSNLLISLLPEKPTVRCCGPEWVEAILWKDSESSYRLFLLNAMRVHYHASANDFPITLRLKNVVSVTDGATGSAVPFTQDGDETTLRIDSFSDFRLLRVELGRNT